MTQKHIIFILLLIVILVGGSLTSCKKQLVVDAPIYTSNEVTIYQTDETALTVLAGIFTKMSSGNLWSLSMYLGLSADELTPYSGITNIPTITAYYQNALTVRNTPDVDFWGTLYPFIYYSNVAMEGLGKSGQLTPRLKKQLAAEARFVRAFCYFYLVNLYGDIPLVVSTDYNVTRSLSKTPKAEIWKFIIEDLKSARDSLGIDYLDGNLTNISEQRVRPTKWAASAMLSRVYLYTGDYANAEIEATKLISKTDLFTLPDLNEAFLSTSNEAIWQLQPVNEGQNTQDARAFVIPQSGFSTLRPVYLSSTLIDQFEEGDQRRISWTGSRIVNGIPFNHAYKYKINLFGQPVTEYTMILRLSEQFLIRAEARIKQNNVTGGIEDLNTIRDRARALPTVQIPAPLPPLSTTLTGDQALAAVYHERQVELFTEWGHRWLDLKRTGLVNTVMAEVTPLKGGVWNQNWAYFPIPLLDVQRDPNLKQNAGYN